MPILFAERASNRIEISFETKLYYKNIIKWFVWFKHPWELRFNRIAQLNEPECLLIKFYCECYEFKKPYKLVEETKFSKIPNAQDLLLKIRVSSPNNELNQLFEKLTKTIFSTDRNQFASCPKIHVVACIDTIAFSLLFHSDFVDCKL